MKHCARYQNIGIPYFSKVRFMPVDFQDTNTLVPVFANGKISKEDFCFFPFSEEVESKQSIPCVWPRARSRGSAHSQYREWPHRGLSGNNTASWPQPTPLNCACGHWCSLLIYFVHPSQDVSCANYFFALCQFSYKRFHKNALPYDSGQEEGVRGGKGTCT